MGTIHFLFIQELQFDIFPAGIICIILFVVGYWVGNLKRKKLLKKISKMEKKIMDLNTELLYGTSALTK